MKMLYVFLSLFVAQFDLASPFAIRKVQAKDEVKSPFSEMSKTVPESTESKAHPFLTMDGRKTPSETSSMGYNQANSLENHHEAQLRRSSTDRTKRESPEMTVEQADKGCRREDLLVNSSVLGLPASFIRPESFNAYQCRGLCSLTHGMAFTTHSLLEAFVNKEGNKTDGEGCCVPTKLRPLSFIYYVKEHEVFERYTFKDLIIEECGCY